MWQQIDQSKIISDKNYLFYVRSYSNKKRRFEYDIILGEFKFINLDVWEPVLYFDIPTPTWPLQNDSGRVE